MITVVTSLARYPPEWYPLGMSWVELQIITGCDVIGMIYAAGDYGSDVIGDILTACTIQ